MKEAMTTKRPLTIYKASAGSGKTFTLSTEYIKLVVMNPQCYRNILAVTFTNKATEEMKMRILSQLYGIWKRLPDSDAYMRNICEKTGQSEEYVSRRAGVALSNLLHNYNYFRVETIDTFFQSVLRNLAHELDLTANLRIGLNDVQVEELAVDQLIEELDTKDAMLKWLLDYIMENITDDKNWNVIGQVKSFGKTIFSDEYKEVADVLREKMADKTFFRTYTEQLKSIKKDATEKMKCLGDSFFGIIERNGLTIDDFSNKRRGIASFFVKLSNGDFSPDIRNTTVENCLANPAKWYAKSHPRSAFIHALVVEELSALLCRATQELTVQWKLFKSADLTLRHLNQLRLLGSIEQKVRQLNETSNRFLLSDTQQLLHALISDSDSPFIFEKIGTQLEHVMIDEFQDTSTVQWKNFKVLLSETMSHQGSENLIVGDVKQSIYRWRSGDWRLLNDIEKEFPNPEEQIQIADLDVNRRSQRNVVAFNNAFFSCARDVEVAALIGNAEAEQLERAYAKVEQKIPSEKDNEGFVSIRLLPAEDYQNQVLQQVVETVTELISLGIRPQEMAILVRVNAQIPLIAEYFSLHLPSVNIVSDEAFRLDASQAINLIVSALHLITHPDDKLCKARIVKIYQRSVCGTVKAESEILRLDQPLDQMLPEDYICHFEELHTLPLYELVERLYAIFGLHRLKDQSAYVSAFYDHLANYVYENATDIDAFVTYWEEELSSKTIQSDEINGIRLISIHKSKGLEFDYVIMPFCDWRLEKTGNILWCHPKEPPFSDLPIAPIDYSQKGMVGTVYEADYHHEHLQNTVDNLNLLYVAFTRACKGLYVIGQRGTSNSRSALIEECLPQVSDSLKGAVLQCNDDKQTDIVFEYGCPPKSGSLKERKVSQNVFLQPVTTKRLHIETFDSHVDFRQSNRSKDFIAGDDDDNADQRNYVQMGSILHKVFSTIRTTADIDYALRQLQMEGILYDEHLTPERISAILRKRLQDPRVADWFSDRWTLFNECTILSVDGGMVRERRPDRVMTDGRQWIVVDFKFGKPKDEYKAQVLEYMHLIQGMTSADNQAILIKGYLWYVYSNKIEEVK